MNGKTSVPHHRIVGSRPGAAVALFFLGIAHAQSSPEGLISAAVARNNEAVELVAQNRRVEAEQIYRAALDTGFDDDLVRAKIVNNLATLYQHQDRYREAEPLFRFALQLRQKNLPAGSADIAYSLNNLAEIYRIEGRDWEARNLMETAVRNLQQFHADASGLPVVLTNLAIVLCRFKEYDQAQELLRSALISYDKRGESKTRGYGVALNDLGEVLETQNDLENAAPLYERAIEIFQHLGPSARSDLAATFANAGKLYQQLDRSEDARLAEQRALELLHPSGDILLRAQILRNLGNIVVHIKPADALPYFEESLLIQEQTLGEEHPTTATLLMEYSSATLRAGNKSLARKLRKRATDLLARVATQTQSRMTVSLRDLRDAKQ